VAPFSKVPLVARHEKVLFFVLRVHVLDQNVARKRNKMNWLVSYPRTTNLLLTGRKAVLGNIGPRSWQCGPSEARSVPKRPRVNIPQYGSS